MKGAKRRFAARATVFLAVSLALFALGGCLDVSSMEKAGLVTLMGIDAAPDHGYHVTVAVLNPLGLPKPEGDGSGSQPELLRSAVGGSVAAAVRSIAATTYLNLDFTHMRGVVVSQAVARMGLAEPLEVLARSSRFEETALLYVARGESASAILGAAQDMMPDSGEVLAGTATWAQHLFPGYADRVFTFVNQMRTEGDQPATLGVSIPSSQGKGPTLAFRVSGTAMFRGDRLVGWLDAPQSLGWLLATGRTEQQILAAVAPGGGTFTLQVLGDHRRIRITQSPAGPRAYLQVHVRALLLSAGGGPAGFWDSPGAQEAVQGAATAALTADIRGAVQQAQGAGADIFSLGEYVRLQDPTAWSRLKGDWSAGYFRRMPVAVAVTVTLAGVGKLFCAVLHPC